MEKQWSQCCVICGTTEQLLRCAKCKAVFYCSAAHQHLDWAQHKQRCRHLAKQRGNNKMQQLQQAVAAASLNHLEVRSNGGSAGGDAMESGIPGAERAPMSVILATSEEELIVQSPSAQSPNSNHSYNTYHYDNAEGPFTATPQTQFNGYTDVPQASMEESQSSNYQYYNQNQLLQLQFQQQQQQQQQLYAQYNSQNNQNERSSSYQIGSVEDAAMGGANERRNEELCRIIINDMNQYGLSVVDDFLGVEKGLQVLNEVHKMYAAGVFRDGQLVKNVEAEQQPRTIRGDKITWVKGHEPGCANVSFLINQIDAVICRANTMKNNGKLGDYNIKERTKAMVACYPGSGSHYVKHVDNPHKDGRVITAIYYLNVNWDTNQSGGVLRIFPDNSANTVADIEPKFDRLILFWSDKRNPHQVCPAYRTRYAITVWYFDANEREAALNRCRVKNNVATTTTMPAETNKKATLPLAKNSLTSNANVGVRNVRNTPTTTGAATASPIHSLTHNHSLASVHSHAHAPITNLNTNSNEICT